jgi:xylono-1,5-lactonase
MALNPAVRRVLAAEAKLGEGALWDATRGTVWFVDIKRRRLWHFDPDSGSNTYAEAPEQIGWALPAEGSQLLCGLKDGLYLFDPEARRFDKLMAVPGERASNRLNDACTDPWGRVWFGSMDDGEGEKSGRFYVFDRGEIRAAGPSGIAITNGPAVNAAGDRIYFTDTLGKRIMVADLTREGVGEARPFADTSADFPDAFPDGPVVDAEDHVWSGMYLGSHVARYSPDGKLTERIAIPARDVTKMAFGGQDFGTAYVTTATKDMSPADMARYPDAGSMFAFDAPVKGFAQARVKLG